jgi:hypothetical protein
MRWSLTGAFFHDRLEIGGFQVCNITEVNMTTHTRYEADVVAWANEQAALLRSGKFSEIDFEKIAEEIEDVGKNGGIDCSPTQMEISAEPQRD